MEKDISVEEALPALLEAALDGQPVARLRAIIRTTPRLASGSFMRAREGWKHSAQDFSLAELAALIRLLTLAETAIPAWRCGSVSPVIKLFHVYIGSEGAAEDALTDWVLRHTSNGYLPYGTSNHGARSLTELRVLRAVATENKIARWRAESDIHEEPLVRRSVKATRNIFPAIRRGDTLAVQALLGHGADLSGRDADGSTPLEYAVRLGHETIVELLRKHTDTATPQPNK